MHIGISSVNQYLAIRKMDCLTAGDTVFIPRNTPHAPAQLSDTGKYLFFFTPSGKMEDFFRTLSGLKGKPSPQEFIKIFADHDMQVVGPPLKIE